MPISENGVSFFGSGGHSHNGVNSTIIDVGSYSLFDFSLGYAGSQSRINRQSVNQNAMEDWIVRTINSKVLQPAGLNLAPDTLNGKSIRANTITADQISANTITANELSSNIVLINNVIRSNNYDGVIAANGVITSQGTNGWAITYAGSAEFSSASIRGAITANSVSTPGIDILANGAITSTNFNVTASGDLTAVNANISGSVTASSGTIGGWDIFSNKLSKQTGFNYIELFPGVTGSTTSSFKSEFNNGSTIIKSSLASQFLFLQRNDSGVLSNVTLDYTGLYIDQGGLNSSYINFYGARVNGNITVPNGSTIKAETAFYSSGSSTIARLQTVGSEQMLTGGSSFRELKENINDIEDAISIISDLRPRRYNFKIDAFEQNDPITGEPWTENARELSQLDIKYGFILEEVIEKRPELIAYIHDKTDIPFDSPGGYADISSWKPQTWEEVDVIVLCVKAIQELHQKNQELETRLQALEGV